MDVTDLRDSLYSRQILELWELNVQVMAQAQLPIQVGAETYVRLYAFTMAIVADRAKGDPLEIAIAGLRRIWPEALEEAAKHDRRESFTAPGFYKPTTEKGIMS